MGRHKRQSGGQPGNQNARKHGFYSKAVTTGQLKQLPRAKQIDGVDQEIAMMRVKLKDIIANSRTSSRPFIDVVNAFARLMLLKLELPAKKTSECVFAHSETTRAALKKNL